MHISVFPIKDLFELPERAQGGEFVLRLNDGLERREETLRTYVVTPQLERNFDEALHLLQLGRTDRAALKDQTTFRGPAPRQT